MLTDLAFTLRFGSCYGYSPSGSSQAARESRWICARIKSGDHGLVAACASRVRMESDDPPLANLFAGEPVLVPVPASCAVGRAGECVPERLAAALLRLGLGAALWPGLSRIRTVRKSATAVPGSRPTVEHHYESMSITAEVPQCSGMLLIDDVVTKGRTLLAAAIRLQEAMPGMRIDALALLRTMSLRPDIDSLIQPCVGEIRWRRGDAWRWP